MKQKRLISLLIQKNLTISSAESCTGGLFIAKLISVPDASKVISSSLITYSEAEKTRLCNVSEENIKTHGVVSEVVAGEMAKGVSKNCKSSVGVGISGIAGPSGGTAEKPVGTVCFGFFVCGKLKTFTCHFKGGRNAVRKKAVNFAIDKLIEILNN